MPTSSVQNDENLVFNRFQSLSCLYVDCYVLSCACTKKPEIIDDNDVTILKTIKTQLIKMLFFSFITKSHTLFMFKLASLLHGNVKAKHERHCALRLKCLVKNVKIVTFLFNPSQILKLYSVSMLKYSI